MRKRVIEAELPHAEEGSAPQRYESLGNAQEAGAYIIALADEHSGHELVFRVTSTDDQDADTTTH